MFEFFRRAVAVLFVIAAYVPTAAAVTVGQVDDFNDGTEQGWTAGGGNPNPLGVMFPPNPPVNVPDGGPNGAGDGYLRVTGEGGVTGPGSRLTAFNFMQWGGGQSFPAGVTGIELDVNNFSGNVLDLRLIFIDPSLTMAAVSDAVQVNPMSGWVDVSFDIDPGSLTGLFGVDPADVLSNVLAMRLIHAPVVGVPGAQPGFAGQVGFDNIQAVPVPPAVLLLVSGIAGLWMKGRRLG